MRRIVIPIALALTCCKTPQQKLSKLVDKYPELTKDTSIVDYDTTIIDIPAVYTDSIIKLSSLRHDTVYITEDRLRIKTFVHKDSIYISGECIGIKDTIISIEKIPYKYVLNKIKRGLSWHWVIISALAGCILTMIFLNKTIK